MVAAIFAGIASIVTLALGKGIVGWSARDVLRVILVSNLAAWCCLPTTLALERVAWFKRSVISGWLRTWLLFTGIYFSVLLALEPGMREPRVFAILILPVIFTSGYTIFIYGPIHDFFIKRSQRAARARAHVKMASAKATSAR
jgi:hypothetical protein